MDQLTGLRVFVKVADLAGFAAAGRALGMSTAMVSKHIAALEARLGVALLVRTTRRVTPTEAGLRFHAHCQEILRAVEEAEREVGAEAEEPIGRLRVTAPVEFGNLHVAPLLPALLERHPRLAVELDLTNRIVDVVEEGLDVAIRIAARLDSPLRGRPVASSALRLVAAPAYLRRHGTPAAPADLAGHALLSFSLGPGRQWAFARDGADETLQVEPRLLSSSSEALRAAAVGGAGIALLPTFLVADELADGRLRALLPEWSSGTLRVWALYPPRRVQPARLRAFLDALVERFGPDPACEGFSAPRPAPRPRSARAARR